MVHIRECMRRWLPFVIMAASLGVSPAQDVASPDAADLDLDLVKLKSGPKGRQREAMRKVLLLVHLKQKETWLAESTGDEAVHLAAEISFRRYLASVDMGGCPGEFKCAFLRYAKLLNSFEEKDLNSVADFPAVPLQAAGRELFRVLLTYRLEPEHLLEEMKALVDEEIEGKEELSAGQMMDIVRGMREALQSGSRPFRRKGLRKTGFPGCSGFSWMACRYREESCGGMPESPLRLFRKENGLRRLYVTVSRRRPSESGNGAGPAPCPQYPCGCSGIPLPSACFPGRRA